MVTWRLSAGRDAGGAHREVEALVIRLRRRGHDEYLVLSAQDDDVAIVKHVAAPFAAAKHQREFFPVRYLELCAQ